LATIKYAAVTVHADLLALRNNPPSADNRKSEALQKALTDAADAVEQNMKLHETAIEDAISRSKTIVAQTEKKVSALDRQNDKRKIPKTVLKELRAAQEEIDDLVAFAENEAKHLDKSTDELGKPWGDIVKSIAPRGETGIARAVLRLGKSKEALRRLQSDTKAKIAALTADSSSMEELLRQMKGIIANADKAAKADAMATERVEEIKDGCKGVADELEDCTKLGAEIKKQAVANAIDKTTETKIKRFRSGLKDAEKGAKVWEQAQQLLFKTLALNYPKLVEVSKESAVSVNKMMSSLKLVQKLEQDVDKSMKSAGRRV
jgi:hypothetical protein